MIPYARHSTDRRDGRAAAQVIERGWLSSGPKVREFETAFAARVGAKHAVAVSSGTAALHLACLAAGLKTGDEAVVPAITFLATANAVLYCGARPAFGDVDPATLNLDLEAAARRVRSKTRAVLPVHYAGYPCDLKPYAPFFRKKGIVVIEDACHALGSTDRGLPVGSCRYSDMAAFSFHPTKAITTGEGGMVTTNDARFYRLLCELRNHGMVKDPELLQKKPEGPWAYEMQHLGFNYRLTDFQSALGLSQLAKLDGFLAKRRKLVALYLKELSDMPAVEAVGESVAGYLKTSAHHLFVVKIDFKRAGKTRRAVVEALAGKGVGTQVHYLPIYLHPYYRGLGYRPGLAPNAEKVYASLLTLPLFPTMNPADVKRIAAALREACAK